MTKSADKQLIKHLKVVNNNRLTHVYNLHACTDDHWTVEAVWNDAENSMEIKWKHTHRMYSCYFTHEST